MSAWVIAVANCKGGTGKSTTAVNLAAELAARRRRVLLVDLDSQGHSGLGFGVVSDERDRTAHRLLEPSAANPAHSIHRASFPGVDVMPADRWFRITRAQDDPRRLARALDPLKRQYDVIVVDTPPAADVPLISALAAANGVLVPTQLTHLAEDGLTSFARLFFEVATSVNASLDAFAIVPTQVDMRTHIQQLVLAKIMLEYGPRRIFRAIRSDVALAEAFGAGRPIRDYRPGSRGAADYGLLAEAVLANWVERDRRSPGSVARPAP